MQQLKAFGVSVDKQLWIYALHESAQVHDSNLVSGVAGNTIEEVIPIFVKIMPGKDSKNNIIIC